MAGDGRRIKVPFECKGPNGRYRVLQYKVALDDDGAHFRVVKANPHRWHHSINTKVYQTTRWDSTGPETFLLLGVASQHAWRMSVYPHG